TRSSVQLSHAQCAFAYRDSLFKHEPERYLITAVRFALPRHAPPRLDYAGLREELTRMGIRKPAPFHIAEAVVRLRERKLPDPAVIGNAGSFFKNPELPTEQAQALQAAHPGLPIWPLPQAGRCKLSAAWLIEAAGFKGQRAGDAGISSRHALVLVNHGRASGRELWAFARRIMDGVFAQFGIHLESEPRIVGDLDS
ncbi:udp-n-acetylenolpyruvoylglucosamine reductase, partial [Lasius niger]